jgi:hypothetical protein
VNGVAGPGNESRERTEGKNKNATTTERNILIKIGNEVT